MAERKSRKRWLYFLLGMAVSAGLVYAGITVAYKMYRDSKSPKRYMVQLDPQSVYSLADGVKVYVASSLDRIFKDGNTLVSPRFTKEAALSLAGHEYESLQVVVRAGSKNVRGVFLNIGELVHENGQARIAKENVSWRVVRYVPTETPYYPVKYVGLWPDPLMPPVRTDVAAGETQPFWVTVYAPAGTPPGLYKGKISVEGEGFTQDIPFTARVYDFTLPVASRMKTAFDFYGHETFKRYPQGERESREAYEERLGLINDRFIRAMLQYRVNPILNIDPTKPGELANIDRYLILGLNNFSIGKRGGTLGNNWPLNDEEIEALLGTYRTYGEMLKLNKILKYTYIYTWDEGEIGNPVVPKLCSMIHRAYPGLKNMVCYHGFWDPSELPDWGKDIDIWTFQIDYFNMDKIKTLRDRGMEVWTYISGPGGFGTPQLAMDFDSMDYRIIPWLMWKYDMQGFLYWCVNWWPLVDPFESGKNTKWEQNGNGLLLYPGENGPLASLRIELFRDGMEDYEYIQTLLDKMKIIKRQKLSGPYEKFFEESKTLLTVDDSIAVAMDNFTREEDALKQRRNAIAEKIEEFGRLSAPSPVPATP